VAGSDLNRFGERFQHVRQRHARIREEYAELRAGFPTRLGEVADRLRQTGVGPSEIEEETRLRTMVWQREYDELMHRLDVAELRNEAAFADLTRAMFRRLYHEAFHAYLDHACYPEDEYQVPRWLNEGLAQIFEFGRLEADTLRIDAPDPERLRQLQAELARRDALRLADVLRARTQDFVEEREDDVVRRRYLVAWGLVYYLVFERDLLRSERLDPFIRNGRGQDPIDRFAKLVRAPLEEFDPQWRAAMRELQPPGFPEPHSGEG
jgi:hypothetical protein